MAIHVTPPSTKQYAIFFRQRVVQSVRRWQQFVADNQADTAALEQRQVRILRAISFALSSKTAWPAARQLIEAFAPYMERRGYWDTWQDILTQAVKSAQRFGDNAGQVTLMALLARLCQRQSRIPEAIRLYRRVIRLARRSGHRFEEARACSNLGYLYIDNVGRWWRAEVLSCHALAIFEDLDSDHGRAHTQNHLGILYTRQHAWKQAERCLKRACDLWQVMGDNYSLIRGFTNLGLLYIKMEYPTKAPTYLEQAIQQAKLSGEATETGTIWVNLGMAHWKNGDLEKAKACNKKAEKIFRQFSNVLGLAQVWNVLGLVYLQEEDLEEAGRHLERSLVAYRNLNNWEGEIEVILDIIEYEFIRKNRKQIIFYMDKAEELINQYTKNQKSEYFQERLKKYRRSLINLVQSATAI